MDKPFIFDQLANDYDQEFTQTLTGKAQRDLVWSYLSKHETLKKNTTCLEINCGTGEDALFLSKQGIKVTATDRSKEMCAITKSKGIQEVSQLAFDELKNGFPNQKFDNIFSNFGGLNCIDEDSLNNLFKDFHQLLNPGGRVIAVIMPRLCIWESIYFLLKLNWKAIFRRKRNKGISFSINNNNDLQIHYYSPSRITAITQSFFTTVCTKPIGVAIPPSYLEPIARKAGKGFSFLNAIDKVLFKNNLWPSSISDHYLIELKLK